MKNSILKRRVALAVIPACTAFLMGGLATSCDDELLTGQPSYLGESIYDELERRGNFTETLKLINAQDEDYASVLKKTGSKTLFAADDAAWKRFYQNNPWGVTSIEDMTNAQKKLLFKSNMINSAYLVELLGNLPASSGTSDAKEGACMRRATSVDIMDSVPLVPASMFPEVNPMRVDVNTNKQIDHWSRLRGKSNALILQDGEVAPMIHFMPKFMQNNNITSDDVKFLTNGEIESNVGAFVNGKVIREDLGNGRDERMQDITCQNGYIHVLEDVALPLDNMANVIANEPTFSIYNRLLTRFSYPQYNATLTQEYRRQHGGEDSVFVKRFFFRQSDSQQFTTTDNNEKVTTLLPIDPGWNRYRLSSANNSSTYQENAAVMLVPTDQAMLDYLESSDGADLKARYDGAGPGETAWDNAPDEVVLPLLTNTMLSSLKAAIPSQFSNVNNSAGETMGLEKEDVSKVFWACNGIIYQTNKVFVAPEYVSVYYPCVVRSNVDLKCVYNVVDADSKQAGGEGFYAYYNNMGGKNSAEATRYSFIIPTDNALQSYYDPVTYKQTDASGNSRALAYKFYINDQKTIAAYPHLVDWTSLDGKNRGAIASQVSKDITLSTTLNRNGDVFNHFADILNSSLCTSLFKPGQKFYTAKNGGPVIVEWNGSQVTGVAGSFQYERGYFIPVTETYDKSVEGNGRSYIVDEEPLMSTFLSPYAAISDTLRKDDFGTFAMLLANMDFIRSDDGSNHVTMDKAITALNNYNYTIYVPKNSSIDKYLYENVSLTPGAKVMLPTWDNIDAAEACLTVMDPEGEQEDYEFLKAQIQSMKDVITNFVSYHIQDCSVYLEGEEHNNDVYESACLDTLNNRFVKMYVTYNQGNGLTVTDACGNVRRVDPYVNNILTRQYFFNGQKLNESSRIYSSSYAVIHMIDEPLLPFNNTDLDENGNVRHPAGSFYSLDDYNKVLSILEAHPLDSTTPTSNPIKRKR